MTTIPIDRDLLARLLADHTQTQFTLGGDEIEVCASCHEQGWHGFGCPAGEAQQLLREMDRRSPHAVEPYSVEIKGVSYRVVKVRYTLRGRVPVKTEFFEDGGCSPLGFNPLLGGHIRDSRYYPSLREDDQDITESDYLRQIEALKADPSLPAPGLFPRLPDS